MNQLQELRDRANESIRAVVNVWGDPPTSAHIDVGALEIITILDALDAAEKGLEAVGCTTEYIENHILVGIPGCTDPNEHDCDKCPLHLEHCASHAALAKIRALKEESK